MSLFTVAIITIFLTAGVITSSTWLGLTSACILSSFIDARIREDFKEDLRRQTLKQAQLNMAGFIDSLDDKTPEATRLVNTLRQE